MVLRFNISTDDEAKSLSEAADTLLLDVWEFSRDWVDIRLSKDIVGPLLGLLPASLQQSHTPLLREQDLARAIYDTYPAPRGNSPSQASPQHTPAHLHNDHRFSPSLRPANGPENNLFFSDYQPLSVIDPWLRLLASLFTTHVRPIHLGTSSQGHAISGLRVGVHPTNSQDPDPPRRKTVLVVGGSHAREWISTSTVNYIAYGLITGYGKEPGITRLLQDFDFVFVPTLNPDGYAYTWETDRLWRKNRQPTSFRFCPGIDVDRAFGFQWDGAATTAGNPCSESFAGEAPFEAVEALRLAAWARNETEHNNVEFVGFLDFHSYSQQILYPYSYSCADVPPGLENLEELAVGLAKAIRVSHGHSYEVLPACEGNVAAGAGTAGKRRLLHPRMEAAGGSALDFFYHEMRVRYAYQLKLRDRGMYGFLLPKEYIVPTGKEMLDAVLYFGSFLGDVYSGAKVEGGREGGDAGEDGEAGDQAEGAAEVEAVGSDGRSPEVHGDDTAEEDGEWVWVEDPDPEDVQWELRRRKR